MSIPIPLIGASVIGRAPFGYFPPSAPPSAPPSTPGGTLDPRFTTVMDELFDHFAIGDLCVNASEGCQWTVQFYRFDLDTAVAANKGEQGGVVPASFLPSTPLGVALAPIGNAGPGTPTLAATWTNAPAGLAQVRATPAGLASVLPALAAIPFNPNGPKTVKYRLTLTVGTSAGPVVGLDRTLDIVS